MICITWNAQVILINCFPWRSLGGLPERSIRGQASGSVMKEQG